MEWDSVEEIAKKLKIKTVPVFKGMNMDIKEAVDFVKSNYPSMLANEEGIAGHKAEGIVARAYPMMLFRNRIPIKWKLKVKDYL